MKISSKKIIGSEVYTQSGKHLGRVELFNVEIDSQSILEYIVKPTSLIKNFIQDKLIIARGQVIEIIDNKIIVDDLIFTEQQKNSQHKPKKAVKAVVKES